VFILVKTALIVDHLYMAGGSNIIGVGVCSGRMEVSLNYMVYLAPGR
jgi:hypothetical protein